MKKTKGYLFVAFAMILMNEATAIGSEVTTDFVEPESGLVFATPQNEGVLTNYLVEMFQELDKGTDPQATDNAQAILEQLRGQ